jgi:excinuclease UvrABC helicase subunit UvrB
MDDARVKKIFEKETYRMVRGEMMLLKGLWFGTLYNMEGRNINDGCNSSIFHDIGVQEITPTISREKVMLWHQRLEHIREKDLRLLHGKGMVEGISNFSMDFDFFEHCVYGK